MNPEKDTWDIFDLDENGKKTLVATVESWEEPTKPVPAKGHWNYARRRYRKESDDHKAIKYVDAVSRATPSTLAALVAFSGGDASPDILAVLFPAIGKLEEVKDDFEDMTGKSFRLYAKKLEAMITASKRTEPETTPDAFELHSIQLPRCRHKVHISNIEAITTCHQDGIRYPLSELAPLVAKLAEKNPDLKTAHARSRFDIFNALRGK
jgi:hypothetical protein